MGKQNTLSGYVYILESFASINVQSEDRRQNNILQIMKIKWSKTLMNVHITWNS